MVKRVRADMGIYTCNDFTPRKFYMTNVKTEFVDTIRGALDKYADGQPNMASEAARDEIAESVEQEIRSKFHIFRINRILTGD